MLLSSYRKDTGGNKEMERKLGRLIDFENDFTEEEEMLFLPKDTPLTTEEIIIKQYKLGMTLKQIVKGNGTSYGRVYEILNRNGVPRRHGRYNTDSGDRLLTMTKLERASLISDYNEGLPISEIMSKYDINKHGCYTILDEAGVPRRQNKRPLDMDIEKIANAGEEKTEQLEMDLDKVVDSVAVAEVKWDETTRTLHITLDTAKTTDKINVVVDLKEAN
jgi:hypothetical protein